MSDQVLDLDVHFRQDFYAPAFRVVVNGKELRQIESDVVSLNYSDKKNDIDVADLTVNNWNPDGKGPPGCWKYSDGELLDPWQEIEIWMGYYQGGKDELRRMMVGELVRMTPNFAADSPATLSVRALGVLNRFRNGQISKDYHQKKDSFIFQDIVNTVAKQMRQTVPDLTLATDDAEIARTLAKETEKRSLTIKQQYAINYLLKRCGEINYEMSVDVSQGQLGSPRTVTVHYRPASMVNRAIYNLEWGKTLISFQPSLATANQVGEVIVRFWNPQLKRKFEGRATLSDLQNEGVIDPGADLNIKQGPFSKKLKPEIITDQVVQSDAEALEAAKSHLRNIAQSIVIGKGRTIGLPDLRTGAVVRIKGLGQRFDGDYVVEGTTHRIDDSGYTTEFTGRMQKPIPPGN
jgi:phage protein D